MNSINAGAKTSAREDKYQLGYCYYQAGKIDQAIKISSGNRS